MVSNQHYCFFKDRQELEHAFQAMPTIIKLVGFGESRSAINQANICQMVTSNILRGTAGYGAPELFSRVLRRAKGDEYLGTLVTINPELSGLHNKHISKDQT